MFQIRRKSALLVTTLSVLLLSLTITVGLSQQNAATTLSSMGTIGDPSNRLSWGVAVSDLAWITYGSFFSRTQIDMLKNAGASSVRLSIDKQAWESNDAQNILGIPFRDYVRQLLSWCHPEITVLVDLHIDGSFSTWTDTEKIQTIKTPSLRQAWINWGTDMINYLNPDAILVMDEPATAAAVGTGTGQITQDEYRAFLVEVINTWRSAKADIPIHLYGVPFRELTMFIGNPLPYNNIVYHLNYPYYTQEETTYGGWALSYWNGDLATGKSQLYSKLNEKTGWLRANHESVMITVAVDETTALNWQDVMRDTYDWAKTNNVPLDQWAMTKSSRWNLLTSSYTSWSEIGQFWVANTP